MTKEELLAKLAEIRNMGNETEKIEVRPDSGEPERKTKFTHNGPQITRKEYLKITKKMYQEDLFEHELLFKLFRAEGQTEVNYIQWLNHFPEKPDESEEQE